MSAKDSIRYQIITKFLAGQISREKASELLRVSPRSITRLGRKVKDQGLVGIKHGNSGRNAWNKNPDELKEQILKLLCERYFDFNLKHFCEILQSDHGIEIPYKTLWRWCKERKLVKNPRLRRRKLREYRHRMPQPGLLLQMDGSPHKFNGKDEWCLISAIDDATSEIPYAEFFEAETTQGCMAVLKGVIERKGIPKAIYTDRAGWSGGGKRINFSQFQRACEQLGIQLIFANSPEGKGRIERSFRTVLDRLIPELRINNVTTMAEANRYLQEKFLLNYWNKELTVAPQNKEPAYSPPNPFLDLSQILCVEETRKVGNDRTVGWQGSRYRIIDEQYAYGSFEAVFRTDLEGRTRVFVRDREVGIELIQEPIREPVETPEKLVIDKRVCDKMLRLVDSVHTVVRVHKVTGKPLKMPTSQFVALPKPSKPKRPDQ